MFILGPNQLFNIVFFCVVGLFALFALQLLKVIRSFVRKLSPNKAKITAPR